MLINWLKALQPSDWLQLISILASIIAIFVSHWLGRWDASRKNRRQQKADRYSNLYVPVIKFLFSLVPNQFLFVSIVGEKKFNNFDNLIKNNLKYLGKTSADKYYKLSNTEAPTVRKALDKVMDLANQGKLKEGDSLKVGQDVLDACDLFNDFVLEVLQESVNLARELGLEPIGQSLLDVYSEKMHRQK